MTLTNTSTGTTSAVIWGQTVGTGDPATNNTVKNLNLVGNAPTTTLAGVGFGSSAIGSGSLGTRNDNNRVQNNNIAAVQFGIYSQGASATNKNVGTVISGNTAGGAGALGLGRAGILVGFDDGVQITNNTINNVTAANSADVFGIAAGGIGISTTTFTNDEVVNATITGNTINGVVKTDTFSAAGISYGTPGYGTTRIANNMVAGVNANGTSGDFAAGIFIGGSVTAPIQVQYNSVSMTGARDSASLATSPSFALAVLGSNPQIDIRDNVLFNTQTSATAASLSYAIGFASAAPFSNITSNYNDLFTSGTSSAFSRIASLAQSTGFDLTSLAAFQGATGKDANSVSGNPQFISTSNLHINPAAGTVVESTGTPIAGITTDIDGDSRNATTPDIGADEGNFTAVLNNDMQATAFVDPTNGGSKLVNTSFSPQASFSNNGLNNQTSVTVRYRICTDGSCTTELYNTTQTIASINSGATTTVSFASVAGGLSAGTYAIKARSELVGDQAPANDEISGSFTVEAPLSGNYTVGAGGTYASLTQAVGKLNALGISGPVTITLLENLNAPETVESYPITINAIPGASATNIVTMKPGSAGITMTGSSASALIVLNGAKFVTIDGSSNGTLSRDLTMTNTNSSTSSAVIWLQTSTGAVAATNNAVKNVNLVGNSNTTTLIGVGSGSSTIGIASLGTGNNNNTFQNNNISKTQYGIYSQGASAASKNTGNVITQNLINTAAPNNVQIGGIMVGFEDSIQITGNSVSGMTRSSSTFGIAVGFVTASFNGTTFTGNEVTNATISRNFIGSVVSTGTFSGMGIAAASFASGTTQIDNNIISGVTANSTPGDFSAGIFVGGTTGTGTLNIFDNSVSMTGARGSAHTLVAHIPVATALR
jgi:hypothetical protein